MIDSLIAGLTRLATGAVARWVGCAPEDRPRVYFANHGSHLDAIVLWAVLPPAVRKKTHPAAAKDYWTAGRARRYLAENVFHAVLVERKRPTRHNNPITDMLNAIGDDGSLILFPEGGRFLNPDPAPFKSGLFHLAKKRPDLELIPVYLENLNRILPKGEFLPVPLVCSVSFGCPMRLEQGEPRDEFLARARQAVMDLRDDQLPASPVPTP